jgi:hypothetical protein
MLILRPGRRSVPCRSSSTRRVGSPRHTVLLALGACTDALILFPDAGDSGMDMVAGDSAVDTDAGDSGTLLTPEAGDLVISEVMVNPARTRRALDARGAP